MVLCLPHPHPGLGKSPQWPEPGLASSGGTLGGVQLQEWRRGFGPTANPQISPVQEISLPAGLFPQGQVEVKSRSTWPQAGRPASKRSGPGRAAEATVGKPLPFFWSSLVPSVKGRSGASSAPGTLWL